MFPVFLYLANSSRNAKRTSPPGIGVRFLATRRLYVVKILNGRASYGEFAYIAGSGIHAPRLGGP